MFAASRVAAQSAGAAEGRPGQRGILCRSASLKMPSKGMLNDSSSLPSAPSNWLTLSNQAEWEVTWRFAPPPLKPKRPSP